MLTTTAVEKWIMAMPLTDFIKSIRSTNLVAGFGLVGQGQTTKAWHIQGIGLMTESQLGRIDFHLSL